MAKQLDFTRSITSTGNNGIHRIYCSPHTTISRLSCLGSKQKPGLINISVLDWTTTKLYHSNQQVPYQSSSHNLISDWAMIVALNMIHLSSENYTTGISSTVSSTIWHTSDFRRTAISHKWACLTLRAVKSTARRIREIGDGIHRISLTPEQRLCQ
jgi:hypothetical protein